MEWVALLGIIIGAIHFYVGTLLLVEALKIHTKAAELRRQADEQLGKAKLYFRAAYRTLVEPTGLHVRGGIRRVPRRNNQDGLSVHKRRQDQVLPPEGDEKDSDSKD